MSILDRLVAEKVMGWPIWDADAFKPSTDMNAAMEVADILINRGWTFFLEYAKGRFWCLLSQGSWADVARWSLISREHTNPATAICLAALAAVGVEYKEATPESEVKRGEA